MSRHLVFGNALYLLYVLRTFANLLSSFLKRNLNLLSFLCRTFPPFHCKGLRWNVWTERSDVNVILLCVCVWEIIVFIFSPKLEALVFVYIRVPAYCLREYAQSLTKGPPPTPSFLGETPCFFTRDTLLWYEHYTVLHRRYCLPLFSCDNKWSLLIYMKCIHLVQIQQNKTLINFSEKVGGLQNRFRPFSLINIRWKSSLHY